ncbi:uncharacterized protein LOC142349204 [Convolutriloba macropyga]|uniref:uncharacterized protein LOC142349204 n=1 Tax=Convolutriloba macropyga TaxID=536237 RepID=UPI003F5220BA
MVCRKDEPIYGLSLVMEQLWTLPLLTETSEHQVLCPPLQVENLLEYELVIFQRCMELANSCTSYVLAFERKISSRIERALLTSPATKTISCFSKSMTEYTEKLTNHSEQTAKDFFCSTGSVGDCGAQLSSGWRGQKVNCSEEGRQFSLRPYSDDIYEITLLIFLHHTTIQVRNYSFSILRVSIMQDPKAEIVKNFKIRPREQVSSSRTDAFCSCHQPHSSANRVRNKTHNINSNNNNRHANSHTKQGECFSARSTCGPMQSTASEGNRWSSSGCLGEMKVALITLHNTVQLNSGRENLHMCPTDHAMTSTNVLE